MAYRALSQKELAHINSTSNEPATIVCLNIYPNENGQELLSTFKVLYARKSTREALYDCILFFPLLFKIQKHCVISIQQSLNAFCAINTDVKIDSENEYTVIDSIMSSGSHLLGHVTAESNGNLITKSLYALINGIPLNSQHLYLL